MTQAPIVTHAVRSVIGKESTPVPYEVDNTGCRQFARAVGYTDPVFFDEAHARTKGYRGILAPPGFLGHPIIKSGQPAPPGESLRIDLPLKRILNGGTDIEYFADVCSGDALTATTKITDITEREGRLGPMVIVQSEITFRNQEGETVAIQRGTLIRY